MRLQDTVQAQVRSWRPFSSPLSLPPCTRTQNLNNINDFIRDYNLNLVLWDLAEEQTIVDEFQVQPLPFPEHTLGTTLVGPSQPAQELFVLNSRYILNPSGTSGTDTTFDATILVEIADAHRENLDPLGGGVTQWSPVLELFERDSAGEWVTVDLSKVTIQQNPNAPVPQYVSELTLSNGNTFDPGEGEGPGHFSDINLFVMHPIDPSTGS